MYVPYINLKKVTLFQVYLPNLIDPFLDSKQNTSKISVTFKLDNRKKLQNWIPVTIFSNSVKNSKS